jgi:hypothetical protein
MGDDFDEGHHATRNHAEGFLTTLASSPGIPAWKVEQATDFLTILLGSVIGQEWVRTHGTIS